MSLFSRSYHRFFNRFNVIISIVLVLIVIIIKSISSPSMPQDMKILRFVKTIKVEKKTSKQSHILTGEILAKNEIDLGFRTDGKLIECSVSTGDMVKPGQIVARLDPVDAKDNFSSAQSNLAGAQAALNQAVSNEARQKILLSKGVIANAKYEDATAQLQLARAKVEGATADLNQAQNRIDYTNLRADNAGVITAVNVEAGEIVKQGQAVMRIATDEGIDAVFDVADQLFENKTSDKMPIEVSLSQDPNIKTIGYVRQISPQADPVSRTFKIKVDLPNPPKELKLGSAVNGLVVIDKDNDKDVVELPAMSLTKSNSNPAVWIVNPQDNTVSLREVKIISYNKDIVVISQGLQNGDIVVVAGAHSLYPSQMVKLHDK